MAAGAGSRGRGRRCGWRAARRGRGRLRRRRLALALADTTTHAHGPRPRRSARERQERRRQAARPAPHGARSSTSTRSSNAKPAARSRTSSPSRARRSSGAASAPPSSGSARRPREDRLRRVIATGGGTVVDPRNRWLLLRGRVPVWLDGRPEVLAQRLRRSRNVRPLIAGRDPIGAVRALATARERFYAAAHRVNAVTEVSGVMEIVDRLVADGPAAGAVLLRARDPDRAADARRTPCRRVARRGAATRRGRPSHRAHGAGRLGARSAPRSSPRWPRQGSRSSSSSCPPARRPRRWRSSSR